MEIQTHTCSKCKVPKPLSEFHKNSSNKNGLASQCKKCYNARKRSVYDPEKDKIRKQKFYEQNPNYNKSYNELNREKINAQNRQYRKDNKEAIKAQQKIGYQKNRKEVIRKAVEYERKRAEMDPLFKLRKRIRQLIRASIKNEGFQKNSKSFTILGCTVEEFKNHIESKFESWMTWENHGKCNGEKNYGWDLDHIIPVSSAKTEEEIVKLNHYTNFQPLCSYINRNVKRNKIT
mgnify:CR=1 FL=1